MSKQPQRSGMRSWFAGVASLFGGGPAAPQPSAHNLDEAARHLAKVTSQTVRPFSTRDFGREEYTEARSVLVPAKKAEELLEKVRKELSPGFVSFIGTEHSMADPQPKGVELVVAPGTTQFDIVRVAASDAINFGKQTEDLIPVLQQWDAEFGIDIFQAGTDTIQFRLETMPSDLEQFADDVYEFCPDIVDQGCGSVEHLREEIATFHRVFLWWD